MTDASTDQKPRIRLTALSHGAGCACKLGPAELTQVLRHVLDGDGTSASARAAAVRS